MWYRTAKVWTILNGAVMIPLGTYIGYLLGVENYSLAFLLLGGQIILVVADGFVWFRALELMNDRRRLSKDRHKPVRVS